jgi:PAS domain S-box-containing protein
MIDSERPRRTDRHLVPPSPPASQGLESLGFIDQATQQLAAIVESSDDAILTKDLDGIITSWNQGAERIFGYTAEEVIGQSVTLLIPANRPDEEPEILKRIRRGERIDHYETIRQRKDGSLIDISLTVSPLKDASGNIVGASKIARDITERQRALKQQQLLLREMAHRVKNVFALASSLVALSARNAETPGELADMVRDRLGALYRAHALTLPGGGEDSDAAEQHTRLHALLRTILLPHLDDDNEKQVAVVGEDVLLNPQAVTPVAMVLNELATNAAKHGALSVTSGRIAFECRQEDDHVVMCWTERDGPSFEEPSGYEGFGSRLIRTAVERQLGGTMRRKWHPGGLTVTLVFDRAGLLARFCPTPNGR